MIATKAVECLKYSIPSLDQSLPGKPQAPEIGQKGWNEEDFPWWRRNSLGSTKQVRYTYTHGANWLALMSAAEATDVTARLSLNSHDDWESFVSIGRKQIITPIFKKGKKEDLGK